MSSEAVGLGRFYSMSADEFQSYVEWTGTVAVHPKHRVSAYLWLGLLSEAGELAAMFKRVIRDQVEPSREDVPHELGDVAWYLTRLQVEKLIKPAEWFDLELEGAEPWNALPTGCSGR